MEQPTNNKVAAFTAIGVLCGLVIAIALTMPVPSARVVDKSVTRPPHTDALRRPSPPVASYKQDKTYQLAQSTRSTLSDARRARRFAYTHAANDADAERVARGLLQAKTMATDPNCDRNLGPRRCAELDRLRRSAGL